MSRDRDRDRDSSVLSHPPFFLSKVNSNVSTNIKTYLMLLIVYMALRLLSIGTRHFCLVPIDEVDKKIVYSLSHHPKLDGHMAVIELSSMNKILEIKKTLYEYLKLINQSLSSTDQDIYFIILCLNENFDYEARISYKEIQVYSMHSDKTIQRSLGKLALYGLITKRRTIDGKIKVDGMNSNYLTIHNPINLKNKHYHLTEKRELLA